MSEILADSRADRERILDRGIDVRRAFYVLKSSVDQVGCGFDESRDGPVAALGCRRYEFVELRHVSHVSGRDDEIEVRLLEFLSVRIQFGKLHAIGRGRWSIVRQHDRFGFDLQGMMLRQNIELVDPVSKSITISRATRCGNCE